MAELHLADVFVPYVYKLSTYSWITNDDNLTFLELPHPSQMSGLGTQYIFSSHPHGTASLDSPYGPVPPLPRTQASHLPACSYSSVGVSLEPPRSANVVRTPGQYFYSTIGYTSELQIITSEVVCLAFEEI